MAVGTVMHWGGAKSREEAEQGAGGELCGQVSSQKPLGPEPLMLGGGRREKRVLLSQLLGGRDSTVTPSGPGGTAVLLSRGKEELLWCRARANPGP